MTTMVAPKNSCSRFISMFVYYDIFQYKQVSYCFISHLDVAVM